MAIRAQRDYVLAAALCAVAVVAIVAVLRGGEIDLTALRLIGSASALTVFGVLALPGENLYRSREPWMWLGAASVLVCAIGAVTALWAIWHMDVRDGLPSDADDAAKVAAVCFLLGVATGHGSLLVRAISKRDLPGTIARYATLAVALTLSIVLSDAVMNEADPAIGMEAVAVLAILYVLGGALTPVFRNAERARAREAAPY